MMGSVSLLVNDVSNVSIVYCTYNILDTETTKVDSCGCRYIVMYQLWIYCKYILQVYIHKELILFFSST